MRLAVIADIHGNLDALHAVLADIQRRSVDLTVNLGDVVSGPLQPAATAEWLMDLKLPTVRGNHERQLLTLPLEKMGDSDRFAAVQLTSDHFEWLASFPATLTLDQDVFLCHGVPANDVNYLLESIDSEGFRSATEGEIVRRIDTRRESLILCGHSHLPRVVPVAEGRLVLNPGSVGLQAYQATWPYPHTVMTGSPHARYAIAEQANGVWQVELIQVEYDWESAACLAEANGRHDWAGTLRTGHV
jgi:predicted phosphodiesterase